MSDFLIIGGGIMGLSLALKLTAQYPDCSITLLEKEAQLGVHASGRNSGVLHSGIYYPKNSIKAQICANGAQEMAAFCDEHALPINRIGKVIIASTEEKVEQLNLLLTRAQHNGAKAELIDHKQLAEIEPLASTAQPSALFVPETAVISPKQVLEKLAQILQDKGVKILYNQLVNHIYPAQKTLSTAHDNFQYGHLFNATGAHADKIAKACGQAKQYQLLPFKGQYYELTPTSAIKVRRLIYPSPDLNMPFLGVHFTQSVDGKTYIGPNALPAFGAENYKGFKGATVKEAALVAKNSAKLYFKNTHHFRQYTHTECLHLSKSLFTKAAKNLVPQLKASDLQRSSKVGIRAQLIESTTGKLVQDFVIENGAHSTHVLNAVSPGFTCAFAFAHKVIEQLN